MSDIALIPEHTVSHCEGDTRDLGRALARLLIAGDIVLLSGPLGAGKSAMVSGIVKELGAGRFFGSPTFTLINEYDTFPRFYHADLYRLSELEVVDLDLDEYATPDEIMAIEWPERAEEYISRIAGEHAWRVDFSYTGDTTREIRIMLPRRLCGELA